MSLAFSFNSLSIGSPLVLLLLGIIPLLIGAQWLLNRRRSRVAVRFSSVSLIRAALPANAKRKQYLPLALLLGGLTSLIVGAAEPNAMVTVPRNESTVILALDVSSSMCATDVDPNRIAAEKSAALAFIEAQDSDTRIGLVVFSGVASLVVSPLAEREELTATIENLTVSRGTAIGLATLAAIDAISELNPDVAPTSVDLGGASVDGSGDQDALGEEPNFAPEVIVLLTDGSNSRGVEPLVAAELAAQRQVRMYTIGFGTTEQTESSCTADQVGASALGGGFGGGFGGGGGGGGGGFLVADEPTLIEIAEMTGGEYFHASSADELDQVFADLPTHITLQAEQSELSIWFVITGTLLAVGALALALRR